MNAMFSEDSKYLASWTDRGALAVWEVETGTEVTRSAGHEGDVIKVLFAPDGESLVSFDVHSVVRVWQATTGAMRYELPVTERTVRDLALSDDGRYLATCETNDGWKDVVRLLELSTGRELLTLVRQFTPHFQADDGPRFHRIGFAGDGSLVIAGGAGKTLQAWRVDVAKPVRELAPAAEKGNAQPPSPRPTLSLERVATVQPIDRVERDGYFETEQVFSSGRHATYRLFDEDEPADGKYLVRAYDLAAGNPIFDVRTAGTNIVDGRERIAVSGDGTMLAHADPAGHVVRLRSQDGGVRELGGWSYAVDCVQFSPDGQWLATAAPDAAIPDRVFTNEFIPTSSRIQIWDVATGEKLLELPGHPGRITTLAFSPDGSKLASGSSDTTVLVWDLEDRKRSDQTR
jgi:WD40 repeat protein